MVLAHLPNAATNLPTSAALSVLYLRHTPEAGSYVLSTRWARDCKGCCCCAGGGLVANVESSGSAAFNFLRGGGGEMRYLVVILVYGGSGQRFGRVGRDARLRINKGNFTVVGRASRSRLDCWSHCCESGKYGIFWSFLSFPRRGLTACGVGYKCGPREGTLQAQIRVLHPWTLVLKPPPSDNLSLLSVESSGSTYG